MCGIVGYISTAEKLYEGPKAHFMRFALALDTLRGHDSTGVMTLTDTFKVSTLKTTMPGDKFVHSDRYLKKSKIGWAQVGHNRAATRGTVKLDNAHPFKAGPITLVHNGTLYKDGESLPTYNDKLEVDSMQIALALAEHTPEQAKEVLENIDGSFALVWFDSRNETVNMARNNDRPLHFTYNTAKTVMWFMSDGGHLNSINKSLKGHDSVGTTIYQLDKNKLLKWKKGSLVPEVTTFAPFDWQARNRAKAKKGKQASGSSQTRTTTKNRSLAQSDEAWRETLRAANGYSTPTSTSGTGYRTGDERTTINGVVRKLTDQHVEALRDEFDLRPSDLLEFIPSDIFELGNHKLMVHGEVMLPHWGDCPWDAMIYGVKEVQGKAYLGRSWLVRPIGIGLPMDSTNSFNTVLCHLIHCDWKKYQEKEAQDPGKDPEGPDLSNPEVQVQGPDGRYVSVRVLRAKCDSGCITCSEPLKIGSLEGAQYVNEGRDILCKNCVEDLQKGATRALIPALLH